MKANERKEPGGYGKFKVELGRVASRTIVIPEHITLKEMHRVIQTLFDWEDCHPWAFLDSEGRRYENEEEGGIGLFARERPAVRPSSVCLSDVLPGRGDKMRYTYDYGDGWQHVVTRMADPTCGGVQCVKTTGPDGIEDCGGFWGLHEAKREWHVPNADEITRRLQRTKLHPKATGTGQLARSRARREEILESLTAEEWTWLRTLGEEGEVRLPDDHPRLAELAGLLPGVSGMETPPTPGGTRLLRAENGFRRFWRAHVAEWRARHETGGEWAGTDFSEKELDTLLAFAWAAADLYGVVEEAELGELAGRWRKEAGWGEHSPEALGACAMELLRRNEFSVSSCAYVAEGRAVSRLKYPPGDPKAAKALAETLEWRQGKAWWHPESFDAFLAWAGKRPHWPEEYRRLEKFICGEWDIDRSRFFDSVVLDAVHDGVYNVLASGRGWRVALDALRGNFEIESLRSRDGMRLVELLVAASNATRHDANRGFTPDEMRAAGEMGNEFEVAASRSDLFRNPDAPIVRGRVKIGRNDPCPCGSGKKYKKCCGAN